MSQDWFSEVLAAEETEPFVRLPAELGVSGIHMYAIVADFVLKPTKYMHEPGSLRGLNFEHHHLVTWRAFHPSKWSAHYYGQVSVVPSSLP
jgi:hypothetical protein